MNGLILGTSLIFDKLFQLTLLHEKKGFDSHNKVLLSSGAGGGVSHPPLQLTNNTKVTFFKTDY